MASEHDDGRATQAEGQVARQVRAREAANTVGAEESPHGGKATGGGDMRDEARDVWEHPRMSDELVRVYATANSFEGMLTKGHLEAEGITVLLKGEAEGPYRAGPVYLWVTPEDEARAREVHPGDRVRRLRDVGRGRARRPKRRCLAPDDAAVGTSGTAI